MNNAVCFHFQPRCFYSFTPRSTKTDSVVFKVWSTEQYCTPMQLTNDYAYRVDSSSIVLLKKVEKKLRWIPLLCHWPP